MLSVLIFTLFPLTNQTEAQTQPTVALTASPSTATQINQIITVSITVSGVSNLWLWDGNVTWDSTILKVTSVFEGNFMQQVGSTVFVPMPVNNGSTYELSDTLLGSKRSKWKWCACYAAVSSN